MIHLLRFEYTRDMQIRDRDLLPVTFICQVTTLTPGGWPTDDPRNTIDGIWDQRAQDAPHPHDGEPDWGSYIAKMTGTEPGTANVAGTPIPPPAAAALFWHAQVKPYVPGLRAVRVSHRGARVEYAELEELPPTAPAEPETELQRAQRNIDRCVQSLNEVLKGPALPLRAGAMHLKTKE